MKKKCLKILSLILAVFILISTLTIVKAAEVNTKLISDVVRDSNKVTFYLNMPQGAVLAGDVNGNCVIDTDDRELVQLYILNPENSLSDQQLIAANVNCDNEVNINDTTLIQNYISNPEHQLDPIKLIGTLAESSTYQLKNENNKWIVTVDIPEGSTEGTIGIQVQKQRFKYDFTTGNEEASEVYDLKFAVTNKDEVYTADKVKVTLTTNRNLDKDKLPEGWSISDNEKAIIKEFNSDTSEKVKLVSKEGEQLEYELNVKFVALKVEEKQEEIPNGNIQVTLTPNKELDTEKIPAGWSLSSDGLSIVKECTSGTAEIVKIVAKDGSELDYSLQVKTKTTGAESKIPQTGTTNILLIIIGGVAIIGIVALKKYKKF